MAEKQVRNHGGCPYCDAPVPEGVGDRCEICGLVAVACPVCGISVAKGRETCPACGCRMTGEEKS